ncbi:TRZ/ATZ family hydrolase [Litchfieldella xinjiangensis]|uniref:TRZ/ATZ family hydrolase n=1 Tax=Litchfieldella xinjiangensis TaxID=1166948 RepID=UPI0005BE07B3|nr:TRZ/ATZ family hydrolase [Halomonas xinjiangensis]
MPANVPRDVDLLIEARWILPMSDGLPTLENHAIAVHDGRLLGPWPQAESALHVRPERVVRLEHHALLPGLINAHNHAGMSLMRGFADDLPLMTWLNQHIWPAESAYVTHEFVADGTRLACAEMLRGGTTTFADMYLSPEAVAEVVAPLGMRVQLCTPLIDFPTPWAPDFTTGLMKTDALRDQLAGYPRISLALGPHAPYTVGDASLDRLLETQHHLGLPIQMHVHETADEVERGMAQDGKRPLRRLFDAGLLGPHFQAVHMTQIDDSDLEILCETKTRVIHCPQSNLKLASGFCPVARLLDNDIAVALGTDGAASNNDLDMFDEMKCAALLAKGVSGDAAALPAMAALAMATREGARVLGMESHLGRLQEGFEADLIAVDLDKINSVPVHHPASAIVYAVNSQQVSHVWIGGEAHVVDGQLTSLDSDAIVAESQRYRDIMRHFPAQGDH